LTSAAVATGAAALGYATLIERNWFVLREQEVPVLPPGAAPLRVLHISDTHLTPGRHRLMSFMPLLDRPGAFVYGTNDLHSPKPRNPARYLWRNSSGEHDRTEPDLPWEKLGEEMTAAGWLDLNNRRGRLVVNGLDVVFAGVHDSHSARDRYDLIAGEADPTADLRLGVMHSPEPRVMDQFAADGYDLLLAGHTHGGQLCVPGFGALVTNCGIDRARVRGLSMHPQVAPSDGKTAWLHVSGGLGTSPWAPARVACRPEATLLTLVPNPS
jgi:uncharacterized protein